MADIVSRERRSCMMRRIGSRDTKPELIVRRSLHAQGVRYRLHDKKLPGKPDLVFRRFGAVCFVHGCFWHRHAGCSNATNPSTRADYWKQKFKTNVERDRRTRVELLEAGWRVAVIWECSLRGNRQGDTVLEFHRWLYSTECEFETSLA